MESLEPKDKLNLYESGKQRRYNLLFAVNGGAFAIAKGMTIQKEVFQQTNLLGNLSLRELSIGMILFTLIMFVDIFAFGWQFRKQSDIEVFGKPGIVVLVSICLLICLGWLLVGVVKSENP